MRITVQTRVENTPRVQQTRGMFDLTEDNFSSVTWDVELDLTARPWSIGLINGPSGSGKSTVARHIFKENCLWSDRIAEWPHNQAIVDGFPEDLSVKDVTALLSAVGFSSPPAWLRPFHVLSTGQQFRCNLARLLAFANDRPPILADHCEVDANNKRIHPTSPIAIMDEYTSVVDRTVAKVGSAAVAKTVRARGLKFVAVTCHDDIIEWLQPDWIYTPASNAMSWRSLRQRPTLDVEIYRATAAAWPIFAPHHYLSASLSSSACCFVAAHDGRPVGFSAWVNALSFKGGKREHRTVVLPDFQGIGLGMALSSTIAGVWKALGYRATSTTSHPAFIASRRRSQDWKMTRAPSLAAGKPGSSKYKHATTRLTAGFEYIGPPADRVEAQQLVA